MKQKLLLLLTMLLWSFGTNLVLADEPTAAVDSVSAEDICKLLKATVIENEASLLIVSHDRNLMHKYADDEVTFRLERSNGITSTLIPGK